MNLPQLILEYREKLEKMARLHRPNYLSGFPLSKLKDFLEVAMTASAKGAVEAGRVEMDTRTSLDDGDFNLINAGKNMAIKQSAAQLTNYLQGI